MAGEAMTGDDRRGTDATQREEPVMTVKHHIVGIIGAVTLATSALAISTAPAHAASSAGCTNGGFRLVNTATRATVAAGDIRASIPASQFGTAFEVRGRYAQFDVRSVD